MVPFKRIHTESVIPLQISVEQLLFKYKQKIHFTKKTHSALITKFQSHFYSEQRLSLSDSVSNTMQPTECSQKHSYSITYHPQVV